ncbi:MAG: NADPH:quinone oxidoreductase family protein [Caulobacterales bacterium]
MRAILSNAPGGPETLVLADTPEPVPGPDQVLIAVRAAGVNFSDTLIIQDKYQVKPPRPFSPGGEASGIVKAIGVGVTHVQPGDRVIGHALYGAMAEYFLVEANACFKIPDAMPFDEGAGLITTYASALYALKDRAALKAGESLLVLGASGGMGVAAIELGKAMGARVIAGASTPEKMEFAISKGADTGICYPSDSTLSKYEQKAFSDAIKGDTGGDGVDVVYDPVGGDYAEPALRATAWEGRYLTLGYAAGIPRMPLNLCLLKGVSIIGVGFGGFMEKDPQAGRRNIEMLIEFYAGGKIRPHVQGHFALAQTADALRALIERKVQGKAVVMMDAQ